MKSQDYTFCWEALQGTLADVASGSTPWCNPSARWLASISQQRVMYSIFWSKTSTSRDLPFRYSFINTKIHVHVFCSCKILEITPVPCRRSLISYKHTSEMMALLGTRGLGLPECSSTRRKQNIVSRGHYLSPKRGVGGRPVQIRTSLSVSMAAGMLSASSCVHLLLCSPVQAVGCSRDDGFPMLPPGKMERAGCTSAGPAQASVVTPGSLWS